MGFEITSDSSGCITITKYILEPDDSSTVILPRGTVRIGEEAFKDCVGIARIILPDNVAYQGLDIDKNAIQRLECGKRFVTDIELVALARVLRVSVELLVTESARHTVAVVP